MDFMADLIAFYEGRSAAIIYYPPPQQGWSSQTIDQPLFSYKAINPAKTTKFSLQSVKIHYDNTPEGNKNYQKDKYNLPAQDWLKEWQEKEIKK